MIEQLEVLHRVKELKEKQAFRAMNAKRIEVAEAAAAVEAARRKVKQSADTLPARENAIFQPVMKNTVSYEKIEETRGKMQLLEAEHGKLVDALQRSELVHARLKKQLAAALEVHRRALKDCDKYVALVEEVASGWRLQAEHREESEIEDLFGARRRRLA